MKFSVHLAFLLVFLVGTQAAVLHKARNSRERKILDYPNIEENLIEDEYDSKYGRYPPKANAKEDNEQISDSPIHKKEPQYVVDTAKKVVSVQDGDGSMQEVHLRPIEEAEIKMLSAAFLKLMEDTKLENFDWGCQNQTRSEATNQKTDVHSSTSHDWQDLKPIINVTSEGLMIQFADNSSVVEEETTEVDAVQQHDSIWDGLSKSVNEVLDKQTNMFLNLTGKVNNGTMEDTPSEENGSLLGTFISSVWSILKMSFSFIGSMFSALGQK